MVYFEGIFLSFLIKNKINASIHFLMSEKIITGQVVAFDQYTIILLDRATNRQILIPKHAVMEIEPATEAQIISPLNNIKKPTVKEGSSLERDPS